MEEAYAIEECIFAAYAYNRPSRYMLQLIPPLICHPFKKWRENCTHYYTGRNLNGLSSF